MPAHTQRKQCLKTLVTDSTERKLSRCGSSIWWDVTTRELDTFADRHTASQAETVCQWHEMHCRICCRKSRTPYNIHKLNDGMLQISNWFRSPNRLRWLPVGCWPRCWKKRCWNMLRNSHNMEIIHRHHPSNHDYRSQRLCKQHGSRDVYSALAIASSASVMTRWRHFPIFSCQSLRAAFQTADVVI